MILLWLLLMPAAGGILAWLAGARHPDWPRWIALFVLAIDFILALTLIGPAVASGHTSWIASFDLPWIPQLGISFELGLDGLSLVLILLTIALGFVSVVISWTEITDRVGLFHANLLWATTGVIGVFLALDLFLFFFFWELMLVPMYFLIALLGPRAPLLCRDQVLHLHPGQRASSCWSRSWCSSSFTSTRPDTSPSTIWRCSARR